MSLSTSDRIVHRMPIDTEEWRDRRRIIGEQLAREVQNVHDEKMRRWRLGLPFAVREEK